MKQRFSASIWQEGEWFIAQCVQVDVASQGATEDEALENLRDALELHFSPPVATIVPHVRDMSVSQWVVFHRVAVADSSRG
jgi:hypothetical protein